MCFDCSNKETHVTTFDHERLRRYYGTVLTGSKDLKTNACCCTDDGLTPEIKEALAEIDDEITSRFYGCGSPLPPLLSGRTIVDLGCGTGRDAYVAARLAGPEGRVIGIDMTPEQIEVAARHIDTHMQRFGHPAPNVDFRQGYIEDLAAAGIEDNSVDVVISNCVINLSPLKERVFGEIFRILKPGGELYFADVFADRRLPAALFDDPVLHGECLAGAMYHEDFRRLLLALGIRDFRRTSCRRITIDNPEVEAAIGMAAFHSVTIRAFKINTLEDLCEDYGQTATYHGTINGHPHAFDLDDHHRFFTGKPMLVCGNTAAMLTETRYAPHFTVTGDRSTHFGPFDCAPAIPRANDDSDSGGACC